MMTIPEFDKMNKEMFEQEAHDRVADDATNSNERKITYLYTEIDRLKELVAVLTRNAALQAQIAKEQTTILASLADLYKPIE